MSQKRSRTLIKGIRLISNPFVIFGVLVLMVSGGWLTVGELTPMLLAIAASCLVLSIVGGILVRSGNKNFDDETEGQA
jgi:hypothetical protein